MAAVAAAAVEVIAAKQAAKEAAVASSAATDAAAVAPTAATETGAATAALLQLLRPSLWHLLPRVSSFRADVSGREWRLLIAANISGSHREELPTRRCGRWIVIRNILIDSLCYNKSRRQGM